jgi:D-alanine-D-alanine ligase
MVRALEKARLPFSGASEAFYITTTSKLATKRLLSASGVPHPAWVEIRETTADLERAAEKIGFPFMVKPDVSAGSFGIHVDSVCDDLEAAEKAVARLREHPELGKGAVFVEPFVEGREFTCFVMEDEAAPLGLWTLPPVERVFDARLPSRERFLAYERYWGLPEDNRPIPVGDAYYRYAMAPQDLQEVITSTARRAMRAVEGCSYARVDMRQNARTGEILVLEVNSQCGLSGSDEATVGSILQLAGIDMPKLVERILVHALRRAR